MLSTALRPCHRTGAVENPMNGICFHPNAKKGGERKERVSLGSSPADALANRIGTDITEHERLFFNKKQSLACAGGSRTSSAEDQNL
jgi:hypothetical protein